MKKIIVHIGYPKTGTTWFQDNFYPYVENYKYFNREEFKNLFLLGSNKEIYDYSQKTYNNSNHILCEEEIINIKSGLSVEDKAKRLKLIFDNPKIIIFIRNQFDILESKYSEFLKSGGSLSFEELINHLFKIGKIRQWNYYNQINIYNDIFGKENVNLFLYEDFNSNNMKFILNYSKLMEFEVNIDVINTSVKNPSINKMLIPVYRKTNAIAKIIDKKRTSYISRTLQFGYKRISNIFRHNKINSDKLLSDETYNKVHNYFEDSNRKLISELGLDIKKYHYPL